MREALKRLLAQDRWLFLATWLVFAGLVLLQVPSYFGGDEPVGVDASSHILAAATLAEHLQAGSPGWWMPHLNFGFPLAHYYQPLPHFATAVVALLLGGPQEAATSYKLLVVLLLLALPATSYFGFRRFGLEPLAALGAMIALCTLSAPATTFGLTVRHFLVSGLYTMLWGAVTAPLALGEGVRYVRGQGKKSYAVAAFALVFVSHGLLALGLIPIYVFAAVFAREPCGSGKTGGPGKTGERGSTLKGRFQRVVFLGLVTGAVIAFWLLPQLMCSDYFGGWPDSSPERSDGFGLQTILRRWGRGYLTDLKRAPVIAYLAMGGIAFSLLRFRRPERRIILFGTLLFVVFSAGRTTFGPVLDWIFPPNARIEGMMRWAAMLHFFLILAAGVALHEVVALLLRLPWFAGQPGHPARSALAKLALVGALLTLVLPGFRADVARGLDTFPEARDHDAYLAMATALRNESQPGRVFTSAATGHQTHWEMAYLSLLCDRPMSLSFGVGVQDSLNYTFAQSFNPFHERTLGEAKLFNIRFLLMRPGRLPSGHPARVIHQGGPYLVAELPGEYGYFDVIGEPEVLAGLRPVEARPTLKNWLKQEYPRGARFLRLSDPVRASFPSLPAPPGDLSEPGRERDGFAPALAAGMAEPQSHGRVLEEQAGLSSYRARVRADTDGAWLLLKVTPHPFWEARVDGERQTLYTVSPAFMGLALEPGEHEVVFQFRTPLWQKLLLVGSFLLLSSLFVHDRRSLRT